VSADAAKQWMLAHQLGRRNLTPEQVSYLRGKQYQAQRGDKKDNLVQNKPNGNSFRSDDTAKALATEHKVTDRTIRNDSSFATAVDTVAAAVPGAKQALLARDTKVGKQEVQKLATQYNVSRATIERDAQYATAVQTIAAATGQAPTQVVAQTEGKLAQQYHVSPRTVYTPVHP